MRRSEFWIDSWLAYSEREKSPEILRKWAGISAISAAMERKVWITTTTGQVYPNMFVILVAPPGVGKGVAIAKTEDLYGELDDHHYAPSSVTAASLVDVLSESKRSIVRMAAIPPIIEFHSLFAVAPELGVLIPQYDPQMMNTLNDLYDCRNKPFSQRRRTKELKIKIHNPQLSILGACTPSFLKELMPEGAWDQGFVSRTMMVFSGETVRRPLFEIAADQSKQKAHLLSDLRLIAAMVGKMTWDPAAAHAMSEWDLSGGEPKPEHPKLEHYCTRRSIHLLKLSMVAAAARASDLIITLEDWHRALGWLLEIEMVMPDLFRWAGVIGDRAVMDECYHFVYTTSLKENAPVLEHRVMRFLSERLPSYAVLKVFDLMKADHSLIASNIGSLPAVKPGSKTKQY